MIRAQPWRTAIVRLLAAALLMSSCAAERGRLVFVDDTGGLDRARVEAAAAPLIERGAVVAVVFAGNGDDRGDDFAGRLGGGRAAARQRDRTRWNRPVCEPRAAL